MDHGLWTIPQDQYLYSFMKRSIGVVAATRFEIDPSLPQLSDKNIKYCITGVGSVATAYNTFRFILQEKPDILIQAGIAGCFEPSISIPSVFIIDRDRFADLGVIENDEWKDIYDLKLESPDSSPYNNGWLINPEFTKTNSFNLPRVTGITVNEISTDPKRINTLKQKYDPVVESMEGAAFHYVCIQNSVSFLQLRAISNFIGDRNKNNWEIEKAILLLNKEMLNIVDSLQHNY